MTDAGGGPVFYEVWYRPFDSGEDSLFGSVLRKFLTEGKTLRGDVRYVESGLQVRVRYKIGRECLQWKKTGGKRTLQEAFRRAGGTFSLLTHGPSGELVSQAVYDGGMRWLRTVYYGSDSPRPAAVLEPDGEGIALLEPEAGADRYRRKLLLPSPYRGGTAVQSYVNSAAGGEPQVCAKTNAGDFCYCVLSERESRLAAFREAEAAGAALKPAWPEEPDAELNFAYILNDGSREPELPPEPKPIVLPELQPELKPEPERADKTELCPAAPEKDYAADHEIFTMDVLPAEPAEQPGQNIGTEEPAASAVPQKYAVAAKGLSGGIVHADRLRRKTLPEQPPLEDGRLIPAKRIVISEAESYLYFGKIMDGLRQGQGRTQMANGHTAYEGEYRGDRRDGFGVYYYKSGRLCYAGNWKQNLRDGMGVAFGARDGSVFVGHWKNNIPTGRGSAFDMDGNLLYTGEWRDGRRDGEGTEYRQGRVIRAGRWEDDRFCEGFEAVGGPPAKPEE